MRIMITVTVDDEYADPDHEMGITEEGYGEIVDALLGAVGGQDIDVRPAE